MSPTLLEFAAAIVLLVVAWQLGVALTPEIFRLFGSLKRDIDNTADDRSTDQDMYSTQAERKDHSNGTHR